MYETRNVHYYNTRNAGEKDAEIWVMKSSDLGESWSTVQSLQ